MTTYTRADSWLWYNGYRLTQYVLDAQTPDYMATFEDSDTWGDNHREQLPVDFFTWKMQAQLIYDDDALGPVDALEDVLGTAGIAIWGHAGATEGNRCAFGNVDQVNFWPVLKRAAFTKLTANFDGDGRLYNGAVVLAKDTKAGSTWNGTGVDSGSSSANGAAAVNQILSTDGTLTNKVQHSTNGSTWADLITFTAKASGAVPFAEIATVAGTVNQHLRATGANSGGSTCEVAIALMRL